MGPFIFVPLLQYEGHLNLQVANVPECHDSDDTLGTFQSHHKVWLYGVN